MARRHEARVHWKHLAFYGAMVLVVGVIGLFAIIAFFERQALAATAAPDPLPKITIVTQRADSPIAAAWVKLLTAAELQPTLVPLEKFDPIEGVVIFCDIPEIPPKLAALLVNFLDRGGAIAFFGTPPNTPIGPFHLNADIGSCDEQMRLSEAVSPVLARLNPAREIASRRVPVALLEESPRMVVDARWKENARAAVMHMEDGGARLLWCGFDPNAVQGDDPQLKLMLRTAVRWVAGQPISDGAVGPSQLAGVLAPEARREARVEHFAFSVDRTDNRRLFTVRMVNRGTIPLQNPTVKIWLPPGVTQVALAGDFLMHHGAALKGVPEEGACLVTMQSLTRDEDRIMELKIVDQRAPRVASVSGPK